MDEKVHNLTNQVRALTELVHLFMKNQGNDLPSEASPDTQVAAPEAHVDTVARTETRLSQCATNESWWRG
ncbi:hypothetical protein ACFX19_028657 [Malus domestica]